MPDACADPRLLSCAGSVTQQGCRLAYGIANLRWAGYPPLSAECSRHCCHTATCHGNPTCTDPRLSTSRAGDYLAAFNHVLLPIAYEYGPDLIIVSAGFDAAEGDPIGGCTVTPDCFAHMTALLQPIAPLAVLLEVLASR